MLCSNYCIHSLSNGCNYRSENDNLRLYKNSTYRHSRFKTISSCEAPKVSSPGVPIIYELFEQNPAQEQFKGYACRAWQSGVKVVTFRTFSTDTTFYKFQSPVSSQQCWSIIQTGNCGGNQMLKEGGASTFEGRSEAGWKYRDEGKTQVLNRLNEKSRLKK